MANEVLTLAGDGSVNTEYSGFAGKACLKQAAELAAELERLGVVAQIDVIAMKDTADTAAVAQSTLKVENGG